MTDQIPPDCRAALRELEAFVDGELDRDLQTVIHDHLGGCTDCLEAFDFHAELKAVIQRKCLNDELPPGLLARIELCLQRDLDGDGEIG